ncbi:hypothetical protein B0H16DRAFT_1624669, partial [Mycena metata]
MIRRRLANHVSYLTYFSSSALCTPSQPLTFLYTPSASIHYFCFFLFLFFAAPKPRMYQLLVLVPCLPYYTPAHLIIVHPLKS